jgi:quercetin dioxygenase-like cupin family protein
MSLSDVARETDISASFLSLVENGKSDIAIGRLVRLLSFYEIPVSAVLPGAARPDAHVLRMGEEHLLPSAQEGIQFFLLTSDTKHLMMPMLIVFEPGAQLAEYGCHDGEEFVYVLDGTLRLDVEGNPSRVLSTGDSAYYRADQPHLFRNELDDRPLRILCVDTPPNL